VMRAVLQGKLGRSNVLCSNVCSVRQCMLRVELKASGCAAPVCFGVLRGEGRIGQDLKQLAELDRI